MISSANECDAAAAKLGLNSKKSAEQSKRLKPAGCYETSKKALKYNKELKSTAKAKKGDTQVCRVCEIKVGVPNSS